MNQHAILVLTHKPIEHIKKYAVNNPHINFYIHFDKKYNINNLKISQYSNIFLLPDSYRINITWAGFTMVQAMINLFNFALNHDPHNNFFHIISGDDAILDSFFSDSLDLNQIYMECIESPRHRYRVRFNTIHADTRHQRKFYGKALTVLYKIFDKLLPSRQICLFGSQWFSISRSHLQILMSSIDEKYLNKFKKKLCPDEHFFQYLVKKNNLTTHLSQEGNKRYIYFDKNYQHGSSPIWLNISTVRNANENKYWFCRKVQSDVIHQLIKEQSLK